MTITRVTQGMLTNRSLESLQSGLGRLAKIQEQLSTGRVVNRPSDSPTDTTSAMRLRNGLTDQHQFVRNAEDGKGWLNIVDNTLGDMTVAVRRSRELGLQGINGATSPAGREALAVEVDQLREGLLANANTTYLGRPVFGGVTPGQTAFDASGAYVGVPGEVRRTVADGVQVRVDVSGTELVGPDGDSLFDDLTALSDSLRKGDDEGIRLGLEALQGRLDRISAVHAHVGAAQVRVDDAIEKGNDAILSLTSSLSEVENADLPRTVVDLQMAEVAYQATLAATGRMVQPSLIDFLR